MAPPSRIAAQTCTCTVFTFPCHAYGETVRARKMANTHCPTSRAANIRSVERRMSWRCASKRASARCTTASAAADMESIGFTEAFIASPPSKSSVVHLGDANRPFVVQAAAEDGREGPVGRPAGQHRRDPLLSDAVAFVAAG